MEETKKSLLANDVEYIIIENEKTKETIAKITSDEANTNNTDLVIRIKFKEKTTESNLCYNDIKAFKVNADGTITTENYRRKKD